MLGTQTGGAVTLNSNGTFTYLPNAGFSGAGGFNYQVRNGFGASASAGLGLTVSATRLWFVDLSKTVSGNGTQASPFKDISNLSAVNDNAAGHPQDNDAIFVVQNGTAYSGTLTLRAGQKLIGQDAGAQLATMLGVLATHQSLPLMNLDATVSKLGGALTVGSGFFLRGFTSAAGITGNAFGTLSVVDLAIINPSGQALSLTNGTLVGVVDSLISGGGTNNVLLSGVSSAGVTLGASGNTLSGATGDGVVVTGGAGSFTFPGNVVNTTSFAVNVNGKSGGTVTFSGNINSFATPGRGVSVASNTGGTVTFSGRTKNISSGSVPGVTLNNNTNATIAFTNGGLKISSTTGTPFTALGGGIIEVSDTGNTITATGAAVKAVNMSGVTLAANGTTFASITSSGNTNGSAFSATSVGNTSSSSFTTGSITVAAPTGARSRGLKKTTKSATITITPASIKRTGSEGL